MAPFYWKAIIGFIILVGFVLFIVFVLGVDVSGPLGDTFGGLFSPIIGFVSIYLIYKTFEAQQQQLKDQREQLNDQKAANLNDKSVIHLEELKQLVNDLRRNFETLYHPGNDDLVTNTYGHEAAKSFSGRNNDLFRKKYMNSYGVDFTKKLNDQMNDLLFIAVQANSLPLTGEHRLFIKRRIENTAEYYFHVSYNVYDTVKFYLKWYNELSSINKLYIEESNSVMRNLADYFSIMEEFDKLDYAKKNLVVAIREPEDPEFNVTLLNRLDLDLSYHFTSSDND